MKLHENKTLFRQVVQFTADQMKIPAIYVEKDYWVTYALFTIFNNEIGKDTVFKGGTALSKCYNMIERFSEDIDLVVLRREGETDSKLKSKLKAVSTVVETVLPEITIEGITHKMGMNRKTAHPYNKEFKGDYGQVRDVIILESTWLGYYEPYTTKSIVSFVGQMMLDNDSGQLYLISSGASRILISVVGAFFTFVAIKGGLILQLFDKVESNYTLYAFTFLAGFSEKFVPNKLKKLEEN